MSDESRISSVVGREKASCGRRAVKGLPGGDGAEQEADGGAGLVLHHLSLLQALAEQEGMGEGDDRAHEQVGGAVRIDLLELARLDAVAQDQLGDGAERNLVRLDG